MKNTSKKRVIVVLSLLVIIASIIAVLLYVGVIDIKKDKPINQDDIVDVVDVKKQDERQLWLDNKAINDDYVGEIVFESKLVDKSFVQATSTYDKDGNLYHFYTENGTLVTNPENYTGNDVYIWTNWKDMSYDYNILGGSVFMDERNDLNDQNIIIYGHHFSVGGGNDPERVKAFTPLELLLEEENYQNNKYVELILDNETRRYELVCVFIFDSEDEYYLENTQYYRTQYAYNEFIDEVDNTYYDKYIEAINLKKLYDTGVELTNSDKTLTLQTCIGGSNSEFEICVFKLINTEYFE